MKLWKKIINGVEKLILKECDHCPCDDDKCKPKTLMSFTTSGIEGEGNTYDLSAWKGLKKGAPGGNWRLLETSDCYVYAQGEISEDGELVGLPDKFISEYHYTGHMLLQQGCPDEFGVIHWPASCDNQEE